MSPKNNDNVQVWIILIARFFVPIMVVLGVTIICIKDCTDTTDPIDNAWKKVEHLCNLHVTDSAGDGSACMDFRSLRRRITRTFLIK